ncbi:phenylalanine--tRNA ligase subunit beta [Sphingobacterium sp. LRF_L2]|uniref:phenylalanine--tRNA ligase subunit beta n=1 Tax=Sphingobacterium sp. LRF_L2 TaxID=3369421 RepID=UPI003F619BA4
MNISYNWLKNYIDTNTSPEDLSLILTDIGLEVELLETVQQIKGGLEGLVVGEVKTCEQHPNADKLKLTTVDIGAEALLHIVCGAPNVRMGLKVIVAPVGTTCFPTTGEPFKITKSKIRGEVSEGMLCGEDEIGLGSSHAGLVELADSAVVGSLVKDYYELTDDYKYEIGLTPNRADAASHLGVARDIAAYFRTAYSTADVSAFQEGDASGVKVQVTDPTNAPRYSGVTIEGIQVAESPAWLKDRLNTIGVRPINNIVDVTNYILHDLGQPLHAFDADRIAGNQIVVRKASEGESFVTLDGEERKLSSEDLVIADVEKPMCIAGVFGGQYAGVSTSTNKIFLESAYFNAVSVRKTSKRHGIKTDSSFRFERGTDPNMPVYALKKAALLILEVAGGKIASPVTDFYPNPVSPFVFEVRYSRVQRLIGKDIPSEEIKAIILALGIGISNEQDDTITVSVPAYKVDVTREVDVIEEVLRIYGYNNIELKPQIKSSLNTTEKPDKEVVLNQVADLLIGNGYQEILNNSLTKTAFLENEANAVRLLNPLSSDLDVMRQNLLFSALTSVSYNQKRKSPNAKYFEYGKTYFKSETGYVENQNLAICIAGNQIDEHWSLGGKKSNFYHIKAAVDTIVRRLNISGVQVVESDNSYFDYGLSYMKGQKVLVTFGCVSAENLAKADVDGKVFFATFDWDLVLKVIRKNTIKYQEVSKFPAVRRDLALLVDDAVTFEQLKMVAIKSERKLLKDVRIFDVYKGEKLPEGKKSYALSFVLQDEEKTLNDKQIDAIIKKLMLNFEKEIGATVR